MLSNVIKNDEKQAANDENLRTSLLTADQNPEKAVTKPKENLNSLCCNETAACYWCAGGNGAVAGGTLVLVSGQASNALLLTVGVVGGCTCCLVTVGGCTYMCGGKNYKEVEKTMTFYGDVLAKNTCCCFYPAVKSKSSSQPLKSRVAAV